MTRPPRLLSLSVAAVAALAIGAGCSSDSKTATSSSSSSTAAAASTASTSSGSSGGASSAMTKVDANTASKSEIAAALKANGVSNPDRWADELEEYRPYPTDDPTFAKLKQNLAKYKPSAETLAGILATLSL